MNFLRGIFFLFSLWFLVGCGSGICLKDDETTYNFDENDKLGSGSFGNVYKGYRTKGETTDVVAIKVAHSREYNLNLKHENDIYELISTYEHPSIPKFYKYFPETNDSSRVNCSNVVLVTELLGENLGDVFEKFPYFSIVTSMRIGLQVLDALEHLHRHNIIHFDVHRGNLAIGFYNDSRIYLFDLNVEFETINKTIVLKEYYLHDKFYDRTGFPPVYDIKQFIYLLLTFLGEHILNYPDDYPQHYNIIRGHREVIQLLSEFKDELWESKSNYPDYDALRNILRTELEKHKDKANYDKFDWQITEQIPKAA